MKNVGKKILNTFWDMLFPPRCLGCKKWDVLLCKECGNSILATPARQCLYCFNPIQKNSRHFLLCDKCLLEQEFCQIFSFGEYSGLLKELIHNFKYEFMEELHRPLGDFAEQLFAKVFLTNNKLEKIQDLVVLVPVPLHASRLAWRGFNQAELISQRLVQKYNLSCLNLLERKLPTRVQMKLDREERWQNVKNCFGWNKKYNYANFINKIIILVDDITTTGATLESCFWLLRQNKIENAVGFVLAHGG